MDLGIGEIIKPVQDSLAPIGGTLGDIWQAVVGDRVAAWRLKNAMALQSSIFAEAKKVGLALDTSKVPERYAFAWFEEATKQDEPEIRELFARLLLRASQGYEDALDRRHIATLSQFTPADAQLLKYLFNPSIKQRVPLGLRVQARRWDIEILAHNISRDIGDSFYSSLEHLINLGVLTRDFRIGKTSPFSAARILDEIDIHQVANQAIKGLRIKNEVMATILGSSLYDAIKSDHSL